MRNTKNWTKKEEELLLSCNGKTINELMVLFPNRTQKGIYVKCSRLNIHILRENIWTEDEINLIKENTNLSIRELCRLLPYRTKYAIQARCSILGLDLDRTSSSWDLWEIDILKNNQDKTLEEIYQLLPHKKPTCIYSCIKAYGLKFKYFNEKYKIIDDKLLCNKCNIYKEYNNNNFDINDKKHYVCKECKNKVMNINKYKRKYNIILDFNKMFETYSPEEWYEFYYSGILNKFPYEISRNKEYMNIIFKYAIINKLNYTTRENIISLNTNDLIKIKLHGIITNSSIFEILNYNFPELNIHPWELNVTITGYWLVKNNADEFMKWYIENNINIKNMDIKSDIPKIFTISNMANNNLHKLNSCIRHYHHYNSYYEWLSSLYPEWQLVEEDFKIRTAKDGAKLNSLEELQIYEFIKYNLKIHVKSVGLNKKKYKYYNNKYNEGYIPDFIINKINNHDLDKDLIIEYYGLYYPTHTSEFTQIYVQRTHRKNDFYKNNSDIYFIDLYPQDLKNNFEGVRNKLTSFLMENFNLDISDYILKEVK